MSELVCSSPVPLDHCLPTLATTVSFMPHRDPSNFTYILPSLATTPSFIPPPAPSRVIYLPSPASLHPLSLLGILHPISPQFPPLSFLLLPSTSPSPHTNFCDRDVGGTPTTPTPSPLPPPQQPSPPSPPPPP